VNCRSLDERYKKGPDVTLLGLFILSPLKSPKSRFKRSEGLTTFSIWELGRRDSNPDKQIQSLRSYRWTTSQNNGTIVAERLFGMLPLGVFLQVRSRFPGFPVFAGPFNDQVGKDCRVQQAFHVGNRVGC
jgi:hypothetical protein